MSNNNDSTPAAPTPTSVSIALPNNNHHTSTCRRGVGSIRTEVQKKRGGVRWSLVTKPPEINSTTLYKRFFCCRESVISSGSESGSDTGSESVCGSYPDSDSDSDPDPDLGLGKNTVVLVIQNSPWLAGLHLPRRKCKVRLRRKA